MNQQEIEESLNDYQNKVLEKTLSVINDKQLEVNLWRNRTQMLAAKFEACSECGSQKDWIPEMMTCKQCRKEHNKYHGR